ncbi:CD3D protein, partial [Atractosteus spatula]|nr:CD3D protein [Atractosteus spatula]
MEDGDENGRRRHSRALSGCRARCPAAGCPVPTGHEWTPLDSPQGTGVSKDGRGRLRSYWVAAVVIITALQAWGSGSFGVRFPFPSTKGRVLQALECSPPRTGNAQELITAKDEEDKTVFTCNKGSWSNDPAHKTLELEYQNKRTGYYTCNFENNNITLYVKFRTCDNCIQADASTIAGIVVGDLVATLLIGVAVYCVSSQPKGRSYSNNKASDGEPGLELQPAGTEASQEVGTSRAGSGTDARESTRWCSPHIGALFFFSPPTNNKPYARISAFRISDDPFRRHPDSALAFKTRRPDFPRLQSSEWTCYQCQRSRARAPGILVLSETDSSHAQHWQDLTFTAFSSCKPGPELLSCIFPRKQHCELKFSVENHRLCFCHALLAVRVVFATVWRQPQCRAKFFGGGDGAGPLPIQPVLSSIHSNAVSGQTRQTAKAFEPFSRLLRGKMDACFVTVHGTCTALRCLPLQQESTRTGQAQANGARMHANPQWSACMKENCLVFWGER